MCVFIAKHLDSIVITAIGTFIGAVLGLVVTLLVSGYYSKKSQLQLQENIKVLFTETRQVRSAIVGSPDIGARLDYDDKGTPIKTAWGGSEASVTVRTKVEGRKVENENGENE